MATQVTLTPAEQQAFNTLNQLAYTMVHKLTQFPHGQPGALPEILSFQTAWDSSQVQITSMLQKAGSNVKFFNLNKDGLWGPNTASAFGICCLLPGTPAPPTHSAGIATWYAANQSIIDQALQPNTVGTAAVSQAQAPVTTSPNTNPPVPTGSGTSVVTNVTAPTTTAKPKPTVTTTTAAPVKLPTQPVEAQSSMVPSSAKAAISKATTKSDPPIEVDFDTGSTIVAAPTRSRLPWIAAGIAAVALAGVMFYEGKHRRRRA